MNKHNVIERIQTINFICIDDNTEDRSVFIGRQDVMKSTLDWSLKTSRYVSLKTRNQYLKFIETSAYDDFHLTAHYIMLDRIIETILFGIEPEKLELRIENTLKCSVGDYQSLVDDIYRLMRDIRK